MKTVCHYITVVLHSFGIALASQAQSIPEYPAVLNITEISITNSSAQFILSISHSRPDTIKVSRFDLWATIRNVKLKDPEGRQWNVKKRRILPTPVSTDDDYKISIPQGTTVEHSCALMSPLVCENADVKKIPDSYNYTISSLLSGYLVDSKSFIWLKSRQEGTVRVKKDRKSNRSRMEKTVVR